MAPEERKSPVSRVDYLNLGARGGPLAFSYSVVAHPLRLPCF
jgi:hypothetical protein